VNILCDGKSRGKCPFNTGSEDFPGRSHADAPQQVRIVAGAKPDIMGKNSGSPDVVVAVNGVNCIENGYWQMLFVCKN
jgi:hypothetical protein